MVEILISSTGKLMSVADGASAPESLPPVVALPEILPPEPPRKPLSAKTVKRILENAVEEYSLFPDLDDADLLRWEVLEDGTTVGVIENTGTTVRYHWTICPKSFKPLNLGPIDD